MGPDKQKNHRLYPVSFRSILTMVIVLLLAWVGISINHYYQTKQQIRHLFQNEAGEMAATLVMGEQSMSRIMERLEEEQANRLLAVGYWLRDREIQELLRLDTLQEAAESAHVFNLVLFDSHGNREMGLRGGSPPWSGRGARQGGGGSFHSNAAKRFLKEEAPYWIEGLHQSGGFGGSRFSVLVRRLNGGAIMINIDAREQEQIIKQYGPGALLKEFSDRPNIHYVHRTIDGTIQERFGQSRQETAPQVYEVITRLPNSTNESLTIGFNNQPILENDRILYQRMLISFFVAGFLGFLILLWYRLQTSYVRQSHVLQQFQSYHQTVLETMEEAVVAWDDSETVTFWNPKAERLFPELSSGSSARTISRAIREIRDNIQESKESIVELPEPDRGKRRYRAEKTVIQEPSPTHLLFLTDVTEVEEATREHSRHEHLEALAKVASGVAHEVRNPLNTIDMTIQTLCMEPSTLQPDDRETMESLRQEIERINSIVEHFLAYGRPKPPIFSGVNINTILQEISTFLEPTLQDLRLKISVETKAAAKVKADAQQARQALLNIILNAMEASGEDSEIFLKTEDQEDAVVCTCRDQGCGMTGEQIQNIYDPYVTHKPGGTGLGMGIVKHIMDVHGGTITIESSPGRGTVIALRFPKSSH